MSSEYLRDHDHVIELRTVSDCDQALHKLLHFTLRSERLTAERDVEIAAIQHKHNPGIQKCSLQISELEMQMEQFYVNHREELEQDGKKSLQLAHGLIGMRAPAHPALIPLNDKWSWDKIAAKCKELWKSKYFHKPKPPGLDKVKLKKELDADGLKACGLKLDETETFYLELNRLAPADQASYEEAA